jgi:hypothetical protein
MFLFNVYKQEYPSAFTYLWTFCLHYTKYNKYYKYMKEKMEMGWFFYNQKNGLFILF